MLHAKNLSLRLGGPVLLDAVSFVIEPGERVCLLGRNGEGKSTLMRVILGEQVADDGELILQSGTRLGRMPQEIPANLTGSIRQVIGSGAGALAAAVERYHALLMAGDADSAECQRLQAQIEREGGWALTSRIDALLDQLALPGDLAFADASGGMKRRALLGRALASQPDLLLLDEPTNHLDLENIQFLETFLKQWSGAVLFITHDRAFLRAVATRILELDRGQLTSWPGDYANYLRRREERLHAEAKTNSEFDKRLAQEEVWIRKGIEARRTRNMGRVGRLLEMRKTFAERRNLSGRASFTVQEAASSGRKVAELKQVGLVRGDKTLLKDVNLTLIRGEKIGIVGANGAGKSSLLQLLLGQIEASSGTVNIGTNLEVAWFDQMRGGVDDSKPVWENVAGGKEFITQGETKKHVLGYMQEFLFTPDRARQPTRVLSGGERARLLLAKLFSQPANLLVMDEPTNDLDTETLDLLEELLLDFGGTVLVVSHDREFLDNVATRTLALEGQGRLGDYVGGFSDWLRQRPEPVAAPKPAKAPAAVAAEAPKKANTMSTRERRELEQLPQKIEAMEADIAAKGEALGALYGKDPNAAVQAQREIHRLNEDLAEAYARWEALEARR